MMNLQSASIGGMAEGAQELEKIRQMNKKIYQMQWQKKEEDEKREKYEAEAARCFEEEAKATAIKETSMEMDMDVTDFSLKIHDIMNGVTERECRGGLLK
jgi:hypothetical protein